MKARPTRSPTPTTRTEPASGEDRAGANPWLALIIVVLVGLAYANTWHAPFLLDDHDAIVRNPSLPNAGTFNWLTPPSTEGETVSGRPILNLSFALNYAISGLSVEGYHLTNLAIHLAATLLLFGLLRRTLRGVAPPPALATPTRQASSDGLAALIALTWSLHPLQTGAVTYVAQRAESLAAAFVLLTLYALARGLSATPTQRRAWFALSVAACAFGMATKETAVMAPILVLLYDRTFAAGSFRAAWTQRRGFHLASAATWILLGVLVVGNRGRGDSAGFDSAVGVLEYLCTQADAIVRYLRLIVSPVSQVFDYGAVVVPDPWSVVPQLLLVGLLLAGTVWTLRRYPRIGFLGAWFFLALAPSSSFVPVATQTMAEHRMYLALAAPVTAFWWFLARRRRAGEIAALGTVLVLALGALTFARNGIYSDPVALWQQTTERRPENARAWNNLGLALHQAGRDQEAATAYERALALNPQHAFAHANLASVAIASGRWSEAETHLRAALSAAPANQDARVNLGHVLTQLGRAEEALTEYNQVLAADPAAHDARTNRAALLLQQGRTSEALSELRQVVAKSPTLAPAHYHLAMAHERNGQWADAESSLREAMRLRSDWPEALLAWGNLQARQGRLDVAASAFAQALQLQPELVEAWYARGNLAARQERYADAMQDYQRALMLAPSHLGARANLANCQLATGQYDAAIAGYEALLSEHPEDATLQRNLSLARELRAGRRPAPR